MRLCMSFPDAFKATYSAIAYCKFQSWAGMQCASGSAVLLILGNHHLIAEIPVLNHVKKTVNHCTCLHEYNLNSHVLEYNLACMTYDSGQRCLNCQHDTG